MQIKYYMMILSSLLIATACKKNENKIGLENDLLVKRVVTVLTESKGNDPFVSIEELLFDYDGAERLSKVSAKIIHQFTNRADTIDRGYDEFVYDETGKLIQRNGFNHYNALQSYDEFTYNPLGLPKQASTYSRQWDPVAEQEVFEQSRYDEYTYNDNTQMTERITYSSRYDENNVIAMVPILRTLYHYDTTGNIAAADVYPLSESAGALGKLVVKEEYQYAQKGNDPNFFGFVYSSLYTSGTVALALNRIPLVRQKTTVFYHQQDWPEIYQTRDFVIETGSHGYPKRIIETYAKETYTRLPISEHPMLLTERGKRDSRFEYVIKR